MVPVLKINYAFLAPWIVLSLPQTAVLQEPLIVTAAVTIAGLAGMLSGKQALALLTSASLLGLIVWGKVDGDIHGLAGPDSALLLLQFMVVILLMEASTTALTFDSTYKRLRDENDYISVEAQARLIRWARAQLLNLGKLTAAAFGLSLALIVVGDVVSVSVNQIAVSGILVLVAVVVLLILITYRREPEERRKLPD
jgi:hypothetical protein